MTTIYMNNKSPSNFSFLELKDQEVQHHHMISPQHEQIATSSSLLSPPMFFSFTTAQDHRAGGDHPSTHFHQNQQKVIDILHGERSMKWKCSKEEKVKEEENYISGSNDYSVRVCADCNTTKTPLWRSGPRGPKSLCNACGIRQRKAKCAAMALASDASMSPKSPKKEKKARTSFTAKHKKKKKLSFEEFALGLISKNSGFRQVFPQDEEEAAILLMALSCGLINS